MQLAMHMVTIEDLIPQQHFLRKLEATLDLSFVYGETARLYSRKFGRPPIDPVVIVKYLLVGFLYGIPSERQIEQRIQTDIALRWYLGLDLFDRVPDHSTVSQLRRRKPSFVVPIQIATADAAYDFPLAHRVLGDLGIDFFVRPQKTAVRANTQFTRDAFHYDEGRNIYRCPGEKKLRLRRLARSASGLFWEYQADKRDCAACPLHDKCLSENDRRGARKVSVSYFTADRRRNLERRCSPEYREALKLRQIWCEGTFAAQKRGHNLTRVLRRGIEAAEDHCLLSAAAMNLKRMIKYTD